MFPYPSNCGSHCKPSKKRKKIIHFKFPYPSNCGSHCKGIISAVLAIRKFGFHTLLIAGLTAR